MQQNRRVTRVACHPPHKNATTSEAQLYKYNVTVGKKHQWHDMKYHSSCCSINNIVTSSWIYPHNSFRFHFADFSEIPLNPAQLFNGIVNAVIRMNSTTWADLSRSLIAQNYWKHLCGCAGPIIIGSCIHSSSYSSFCKRHTNDFWQPVLSQY